MIAILSPAKRLDTEPEKGLTDFTRPVFEEEAAKLVKKVKEYDVEELMRLMDVSDKIAELNHQRFAEWHEKPSPETGKRALLAFQGDVYKGFDAPSLDEKGWDRAQQEIRMLSGLYGILRPKDLIMPYRLEMSTELPNERGKDLYSFWGGRLTDRLSEELADPDQNVLVDLASQEYSKTIEKKSVASRVITPKFMEKKEGGYKTIAMKAKRARGLMARFMIDHELEKPDDLKAFDLEGYAFNEELSEGDDWVFTREG